MNNPREIKFRGVLARQKRVSFLHGYLLLLGNRRIILRHVGDSLEFNTCKKNSICQFTGLYDKNGVEIYEKDILEMWLDSAIPELRILRVVVNHFGSFGYRDDTGNFHSFAEHQDIAKPRINNALVVGNLIKNPKLCRNQQSGLVANNAWIDECKCIRVVGTNEWSPNGCRIHPNG